MWMVLVSSSYTLSMVLSATLRHLERLTRHRRSVRMGMYLDGVRTMIGVTSRLCMARGIHSSCARRTCTWCRARLVKPSLSPPHARSVDKQETMISLFSSTDQCAPNVYTDTELVAP